MGVAAYWRGSRAISEQFAREAYAAGRSPFNPDAVPAKPKPRPAEWGSKAQLRALERARGILRGCRKYGLDVDPDILAGAVMDRANVSEKTAIEAATRALAEEGR